MALMQTSGLNFVVLLSTAWLCSNFGGAYQIIQSEILQVDDLDALLQRQLFTFL